MEVVPNASQSTVLPTFKADTQDKPAIPEQPEVKRQQYKSCDNCRKRRQACDAVYLGIGPSNAGSETGEAVQKACSLCKKTNKKCTFEWLKNQPKGAQISRSKLNRKSGIQEQGSTKRFAAVSSDQDPQACDKGGLVEPRVGDNEAVFDDVFDGVGLAFAGNPSRLNEVEGNKMKSRIPTDLEPLAGQLPGLPPQDFNFHLPTAPGSANAMGDFSSRLPKPPKPQISQEILDHFEPTLSPLFFPSHDMFNAGGVVGLDELNLLRKQTTRKTYPQSIVTEIDDTADDDPLNISRSRYNARDTRRSALATTPYARDQSARTKHGYNTDTKLIPDFSLVQSSNVFSIRSTLKKIYDDSMEQVLRCWLSREHCPYEGRVLARRGISLWQDPSLLCTQSLYQRICQLDDTLGVLRPKPMTSLEKAGASRALKLATMAFASQWPQTTNANNHTHWESAGEPGAATGDTYTYQRLMRHSLWHQASACVKRWAKLDSFRVIFAMLVLCFISKPMTEDELEQLREHVTSGGVPPVDGYENVQQQDPTEGLDDLLGFAARVEHMPTIRRHLSTWSVRIQSYVAQARLGQHSGNPKFSKRTFEEVLRICPSFNMVLWFGAMIDTAASMLAQKPPALTDTEFETMIVKHAPSHPHTVDDGRPTEPTNHWTALIPKTTQPCMNPFANSATFSHCAEIVLREASPIKVLMLRKSSHLHALVSKPNNHDAFETCISETLHVYRHWNTRYGAFFSTCISEHSKLPLHLKYWYPLILGHWYFGTLTAMSIIQGFDALPGPHSFQHAARRSSNVILTIQKEFIFDVIKLARIACQDVSSAVNIRAGVDPESFFALRRGGILTDPYPDLMLSGLNLACEEIFTWLQILQDPTSPNYVWVRCNLSYSDLVDHCLVLIAALKLYARRSDSAKVTSEAFESRLNTLLGVVDI